MTEFVTINNQVEVNGQTVFAIVDGMGLAKEMALRILMDNNIVNPKEGDWFLQQDWLNAFKQISNKVGKNTLFSIGKKIPENAVFPTEIDGVEKALSAIDVAYHMNHRLGKEILFDPESGTMTEGIGHYHYKKLADKKVEMVCDNPYPCNFDRGIIEAMAKKFKPAGSFYIEVEHDDSKECRTKGGESCTYLISW